MRFGIPPYDDDHEDSSAYTLLIGCEPEDNITFYEKPEPEVVQGDEVSTFKNIEVGESEEGKEGEKAKEGEIASSALSCIVVSPGRASSSRALGVRCIRFGNVLALSSSYPLMNDMRTYRLRFGGKGGSSTHRFLKDCLETGYVGVGVGA